MEVFMKLVKKFSVLFPFLLLAVLPNCGSGSRHGNHHPRKHRMMKQKKMSMKMMKRDKEIQEMELMMSQLIKEKSPVKRDKLWKEQMKRMKEYMAKMRSRMNEEGSEKSYSQNDVPL